MRRPAAGVVLAALLIGCSSTSVPEDCSAADDCEAALRCAPPDDAEVRENAAPALARSTEGAADLTLVVTNSSTAAERFVIRAGDRLLLDALLPPGSDYCGHPPVFSWSYELPQTPVAVTVDAADQKAALTVDPRQARRWLTVMTQDDFPLYAKQTDAAPAFG